MALPWSLSWDKTEIEEFDGGGALKEEVMAAKICFSMETNSIFFILPIFHTTGFQASDHEAEV